jgi:D-alanine-D-alanine ligase
MEKFRGKQFVGILVGGPGPESAVSLSSGRFIFQAFPSERATPFFIYINDAQKASLYWDDSFIIGSGNLLSVDSEKSPLPLDQFFASLPEHGVDSVSLLGFMPLIHGSFGEDGMVLGFFQSLGHLVAGCEFSASMLCFDKVLTKLVLKDHGLPITDFIWFCKGRVPPRPFIGQSVYVKPARQGSSVGVSRVPIDGGYTEAVERAFEFDSKVLVEPEIEGRELECALLQKNGEWIVSKIGEVRGATEGFYSFEDKYAESSQVSTALASLDSILQERIQAMALESIQVLQVTGMARVDFFLDLSGEIYINEINTVPGFTQISMFPFLLENSGLTTSALVHSLLDQLGDNNGDA